MKALSPMRQKILDYISNFTEDNGYPPSVREICEAVNLRSPSTVHSHLKILQEQGLLTKGDNKTRALSIKNHGSYVKKVPILGVVTAGLPILMQEDILGYIPYDYSSGEYFGLRVRGESMINAGIMDGDAVVVRKQETADNHAIVVAMIEDEATVKRLLLKDGHVWLMPENPAFEPIDGTNASIIGIVAAVFRKYF